jgi:DNA-directed RNA polymerase specialized sigma24 family protein
MSVPSGNWDDEASDRQSYQRRRKEGDNLGFLEFEPLRLIIEWETKQEALQTARHFVAQLREQLDEMEGVIFTLYFIQGIEVKEIALAVDRSPQAVYRRIRIIRAKAKELRTKPELKFSGKS